MEYIRSYVRARLAKLRVGAFEQSPLPINTYDLLIMRVSILACVMAMVLAHPMHAVSIPGQLSETPLLQAGADIDWFSRKRFGRT